MLSAIWSPLMSCSEGRAAAGQRLQGKHAAAPGAPTHHRAARGTRRCLNAKAVSSPATRSVGIRTCSSAMSFRAGIVLYTISNGVLVDARSPCSLTRHSCAYTTCSKRHKKVAFGRLNGWRTR
jgi:hypothetical protein